MFSKCLEGRFQWFISEQDMGEFVGIIWEQKKNDVYVNAYLM